MTGLRPPRETSAVASCNARNGSRPADTLRSVEPRNHISSNLPLEPHVFHAPTVVLAVDHDGQPFELSLHASCCAGVVDDWARRILLQFLVDLPNEVPALLLIGHRRLLDEQLF